MRTRRLSALALGVGLLAVVAGCSGGKTDNWKVNGPPRDSRYLGIAILTGGSASVKSDRVATKNGARVDFYLLNLTRQTWRADVSFPQLAPGDALCRAGASEITNITLNGESDATAKCVLDRDVVDRYCDRLTPAAAPPPAAPNVEAAPGATSPATAATGRSVCEIEYLITFTGADGKKVVDPRLEIER